MIRTCIQSCGVARSRSFLNGVGFLTTLGAGVGVGKSNWNILYITLLSWVFLYFCWNCTIFFETFIETENSCCVTRFPLIASCYKVVDRQTSFTLCWGVGVRVEPEILWRSESDILPRAPQLCLHISVFKYSVSADSA